MKSKINLPAQVILHTMKAKRVVKNPTKPQEFSFRASQNFDNTLDRIDKIKPNRPRSALVVLKHNPNRRRSRSFGSGNTDGEVNFQTKRRHTLEQRLDLSESSKKQTQKEVELIRFGLNSNKYSRCNIQLSTKPLTVVNEFKL